ncbi:MAG: DNA-binding protein Alba [Theionarchaea archaeon]|nr:DNA-binding protein Alba [Theionarchaea archaeon]
MVEDNTVFIGGKPVMNYVLAVVTQFSIGKSEEVIIKARGRAISRAVDVAEIVRRRFLPNLEITQITTSTEEISRDDGSTAAVSSMEITLKH